MKQSKNTNGPFILISGPSGAGKTIFLEKSLKKWPQLSNTVSFTTRPPRKGEKEGVFYYFVTKEKFKNLRDKDEFLEWAQVHEEFYATSKKEVEKLWKEGKGIIKDVDVQGGIAIKKIFPHSTSIFIYPPSINELRKRISKRGTDTKEQIEKRLATAGKEIAQGRKYDFKIVNDSFEEAWDEFQKIIIKALKPFMDLS